MPAQHSYPFRISKRKLWAVFLIEKRRNSKEINYFLPRLFLLTNPHSFVTTDNRYLVFIPAKGTKCHFT